jgi:hypothetical protein
MACSGRPSTASSTRYIGGLEAHALTHIDSIKYLGWKVLSCIMCTKMHSLSRMCKQADVKDVVCI